jgi:hypothetical protein
LGVTLEGALIAESLRVGAKLDDLALTVTTISRADLGDPGAGQPRTWTFLEFTAPDDEAEPLMAALEGALARVGGWYCDFRNEHETFVVFADRSFRYPRGDRDGRASVAAYGRSVGVPEAQLDWPV